jgi:urease subunit gamma/beta
MHLTPRELEKLSLHQAGFIAQKRLARGCRLNYPETVSLIATQLLELIRDGHSVADLMDRGRQMLGRRQVLPGVANMVDSVQVEGTFPDGTKLVSVHDPITRADGDLNLALYGSFLPVPDLAVFGEADNDQASPDEVVSQHEKIELNQGRNTVDLEVTNTGDRPIQIGSHYHFIEVNAALRFDRDAAYGMRLDIPAGSAVRFEPGDTKTVRLTEIGGSRIINGGNALATGPVNEENRRRAQENVNAQGFASS